MRDVREWGARKGCYDAHRWERRAMALALDVTDAPRSYNISATAHGLYNVINPEPCKGSHSNPVTTQARI